MVLYKWIASSLEHALHLARNSDIALHTAGLQNEMMYLFIVYLTSVNGVFIFSAEDQYCMTYKLLNYLSQC
jgi:hypothetical protein